MFLQRHSILQKISACFIIGIMVFVYAEKSMHFHSTAVVPVEEKGFKAHTQNITCSICEFQLTKNAEPPVLISFEPLIISFEKEFSVLIQRIPGSPLNAFTNKGPPVC